MKHRMIIWIIVPIFFLAGATLPVGAANQTARGTVFEDSNGNGILDNGEKGIPGVVVSNQKDAVRTDEKGRYQLPVTDRTIIFVSNPPGHRFPLDPNNLPRFYYIHQPAGSPADLKYPGIAPTGPLPASIDFPLIKSETTDHFEVIVVADPQTKTPEELALYRDEVLSDMVGTDAAFYLALGDIMYDNLELIDPMVDLERQLGIPLHHVMGNHDMNFRAADSRYQAETFKRYYGPDYYSFNYGKVHFVVLSTVHYKGREKQFKDQAGYIGHIHETQLTWLENDLSHVPADHLVVLAMHIPLDSQLYQGAATVVGNRGALFNILEKRQHLLALAGHLHFVEYLEMMTQKGWKGNAPFPQLIAGSGCGIWWHGPRDARGIPFGICTDGVPNGYFRFTFTGNRYQYRFHPVGPTRHPGMRIHFPAGTLTATELNERPVNVNIYVDTPDTVVTYSLDDGPEVPMERQIMEDPLYARLFAENKDKYKTWMKPNRSTHIRTAPLPPNIAPGTHRLRITVKPPQGETFSATRLFEVTSETAISAKISKN